MTIKEYLNANYLGTQVLYPESISDLEKKQEYVYALELNGHPVVVGRGKKNRAKVIFDNNTVTTNHHIKGLHVRLYYLSALPNDVFTRILIPVKSKAESQQLERNIHQNCGGQGGAPIELLEDRMSKLIPKGKTAQIILKIAFHSAYSGLRDLRKWRKEGLIPDNVWKDIVLVLSLDQLVIKSGWE